MMKVIFLNKLFSGLAGNNIHLEQLMRTCAIIMLIVALVCFLVSEITFNYSQVDKLWSLMPVVYSLMALLTFPSPRLWIMFFLVVAWGLRLSFNFYRKGGYNIFPWKGEEDYRWKILRQDPKLKGRIRFGLFNLLFISFYQNFLILMFCSPLFIASGGRDNGLNIIDMVAASLMLAFIIVEAISDNQMFRFHRLKNRGEASDTFFATSLKNGFISDGLWRFVRHPNYSSEQAIWICFYLFGVAASGKWINWSLAGPILLVLLFFGSSEMTERISSGKYPAYADYKKNVPRFIPDLFKSHKK